VRRITYSISFAKPVNVQAIHFEKLTKQISGCKKQHDEDATVITIQVYFQ